MENKISIIVPVYNAESFLPRCITSLINQTYENIEIILVDDGSTDSSLQICRDFSNQDARIKVFHKKNEGAGMARNFGISHATGEYIGFVDADDWVTLDMYQYLYTLLVSTNADISICEHIRCKDGNEAEEILSKIERNEVVVQEYDRESYIKKYMKIGSQTIEYYPWNKLYKKILLSDEQYPANCTTEDVVGTYKAVLKALKIVSSSKVCYLYFYNNESVSSSFLPEKGIDMIPAWEQVVELSKENLLYLKWARINRARIDFNLLFQISTSKRYKEILKKNKSLVDKLLADLRENRDMLLKADISFSRKILIFIFCLNYNLSSKCINFLFKK